MRLLPLLLILLIGWTSPASAEEVPASTKDMVHLSVIATNVRLRAGAGTEFAILGKASRNDFAANRYIADSRPVMDSTGRPWFRLLANVQLQTELGVFKLDSPCWIRSDFVTTRALNDREAMVADSSLFGLLHISLSDMYGSAKFVPAKDIPVCAADDDCLFAEGAPIINATLPAGETFYFWGVPSKNSEGDMCVNVYKQVEPNRAKIVGCMPRKVFDTFDFGKDTEAVQDWKKKQNPWYWE